MGSLPLPFRSALFTASMALAIVCAGIPRCADAQQRARVGDRVRFRIGGGKTVTVAELMAVTPDSLSYRVYCDLCVPTMVSRSDVAGLEASTGPRHKLLRTVIGATSGVVVGSGAWLGMIVWSHQECHGVCSEVIYTPVAAAAGGVIGGFLGWHWQVERWVPAVLDSDESDSSLVTGEYA